MTPHRHRRHGRDHVIRDRYRVLLDRYSSQWRIGLLLVLLFLCAIGGGSARADVLSLAYLRPLVILIIAGMMLAPGSWDFRGIRVPLFFLAALSAVMLLQLVPLPPDIWLRLPGHARFAEAAAAAGLPQPWRPISLTPDLTINSLMALLPAFAVLLGLAGTDETRWKMLVPVLIGAACISASIGIMQIGGGPESPLYLYRITHSDAAVGLFANRNHEATFLALALPMLRLWALEPVASRSHRRFRLISAAAVGLFIVAMILVTGSRAGLAVGAAALIIALIIAPLRLRQDVAPRRRLLQTVFLAAPVLLALVVIFFGRAIAVQRLSMMADLASEQRIANAPVVVGIVRDFLPWGSGFGSFDPVFRIYEPDWALAASYFNHAHNDPLELVLTGGVPALLIALAFLLWWGLGALAAWFPFRRRPQRVLLARAGAAMILLMFLASLVDYPLRTPLLTTVFAIACAWLGRFARVRRTVPEA
jgi:hypothetical protein